MLKYQCQKPVTTIKKHETIITEKKEKLCTSNTCYLLLLPVELLTRIFVLAQNPSLTIVCHKFWELGQSTAVRAHYMLYRYGSEAVMGKIAMSRKIVSVQVIEHLLRLHKCNPKAGGEDWLFTHACELNQIDLCRCIIDISLSMELITQEKPRRLIQFLNIACMEGAIAAIDLLVNDYHVDIHHGEETALKLACKENQLDTVKHLYDKYSCNIHIQQEKLLRDACFNGYGNLAQFFISQNADVQAYNNAALQNATYKKFPSLVKILLDAGADPEANQNACIQHAITNGDIDSLHYLITIGGVNPRYNHDWPLRQACRKDFEDIVEYLINYLLNQGMENVVNLANGMPLEECLKYGKTKTMRLLLEHGADPNSNGAIRGLKYVMNTKSKIKNKDKMMKLLVDAGLDSELLKNNSALS